MYVAVSPERGHMKKRRGADNERNKHKGNPGLVLLFVIR